MVFEEVTSYGKLAVSDVFPEATLKNIKENGGKLAISVYDAKSLVLFLLTNLLLSRKIDFD